MLLEPISSAAFGTLYVVVVPACITLIGTLVTVGMGWVKDRDRSAKHLRRIEIAKSEVQFWKEWMSAVESLAQSNSLEDRRILALRHIERASLAVQERPIPKRWTKESYIEFRRSQPLWRQITLSYPAGRYGIMPRTMYRMSVVIYACEAIVIATNRWHHNQIHHPIRGMLILLSAVLCGSFSTLFLARRSELPRPYRTSRSRRERLGEF
jgi:hypothetical protein